MVNLGGTAFHNPQDIDFIKSERSNGLFRNNSSADNLLNASCANEATFVLQQPVDSCILSGDRGKDEEEYLEKVQEVSCPISLIDEKHKDVLINRLATLRKHKEFCDVALYAEGKEILCHKVVLAALSPSFYELFSAANDSLNLGVNNTNSNAALVVGNGNHSVAGSHQTIHGPHKHSLRGGSKLGALALPVEKLAQPSAEASLSYNGLSSKDALNCSTNEACQTVTSSLTGDRLAYYQFNDIDFDSLQAIVNFAYCGSLEINNDQVAPLYKAAVALRVQTCVKACASYLMKTLSVKNCIGLRRCANRTNDALLGNQIDLFIQRNFSEIACSSTEFTSLPCIQIDVFMSAEDKVKLKNERKIGDRVIDFLQRETLTLPEHVEFRMELLTEKPFMLYVDPDGSLQDCNDLDDASSVASCDLVQDYKKQSRIYPKKSRGPLNPIFSLNALQPTGQSTQNSSILTTPTSNFSTNSNGSRMFRVTSNESINSYASEVEELDWKTIAVSKNSENYFVMLSIVKGKLAAISLRVNETPFYKPGLNDRLSLLLMKGGEQNTDGELLATMIDQRCNIGAVYLDGCLIVCGGNNRGECLKSVESFNFSTNKWTTLAPMLKERGRFGACVCDGKIYAVGGSDGSNDLNTCEQYDPSLNAWSQMAPFESGPRSNNATASVGGKVYCIGGWSGQAAVRNVDCYDPETNSWQPVAPLAVGRYQAGCCAWGNYIIVVGGCDTWSCLSSAELYDPSTNSWCSLPPMIAARRGCGAAVLNNKLYVAGGTDGGQTLHSSEVLDLGVASPAWRPGPPLVAPRGNVRLVAADCRIYAVGGFSGKLFSNTIEYLDEGANEWRTTVGSVSPTNSNVSPVHSTAIAEDPVGEASESTSGAALSISAAAAQTKK